MKTRPMVPSPKLQRIWKISREIRTVSLHFLFLLFSTLLWNCVLAKSTSASVIYTGSPFGEVDANGLSPYWKWKTIESENFRVSFPEELRETANRTANFFEEAHSILSPLFRWTPHNKTQVMVINNRDSQNGLTSPVARYGIVLWVTPPEYSYGSYYYDDWLRLVVIHEYTHYLNMDTTVGLWDTLRFAFGDTFLPNAAWPPWMLEGLAVYMETRFSTAGRGRSPYYEMVLRAAVEDQVLNTSQFMTLDKVNGSNPYFPGGDTRYNFGYHLMNQVALNPSTLTNGTHNDDVLGVMSQRSGARFPLFINGNLENITGKTWYDYWDIWVSQTQDRVKKELAIIHSQPVSTFTLVTEKEHSISNDISGIAISPDGQWIAYSLSSADRRPGLYLRNNQTGESKRVMDKLAGIGMKFTPDSKSLILSRLHQIGQYTLYSDLEIYSIVNDSSRWLTSGLRARDPDLSKDGKWVTFTLSENSETGLAIAPLSVDENGNSQIGPVEKLFMPPALGRVGNPQFSLDGKKVFFAYHPNEKSKEDIMEIEISSKKLKVLVSNGRFNRYPVINGNGDLYYVSDTTGLDNLFHYDFETGKSSLATNMSTGIGYPAFGPKTKSFYPLFAGVFSYTGWNLAQVDLLDHPISVTDVTIAPAPAPEVGPHSASSGKDIQYPVEDYSIFPSIFPRIWTPLLGIDSSGLQVGAEIFGFDATNTHRYLVGGSYNTNFQLADGYALYSNRSLGPVIEVSGDISTTYVRLFSSNSSIYAREKIFTSSIAYPFLWTYSAFTPQVNFNLQQFDYYRTQQSYSQGTLYAYTDSLPSVDAVINYSNAETSNLALMPEAGGAFTLGTRTYFSGTSQFWKGLFVGREYLRVDKHAVLSPSVKAQWVSQVPNTFVASGAFLQGRALQTLVSPFPGDNFNQLAIRGYPNFLTPPSRFGAVSALDLQFPISRIFRGFGTSPLFFDNLYALAFAEASYFPYLSSGYLLTSAGTGLRLSLEICTIPLVLSGEYHQGFRKDFGGTNDLFFQTIVNALTF